MKQIHRRPKGADNNTMSSKCGRHVSCGNITRSYEKFKSSGSALGPLRHKLWNCHPQDDSAACWPLRTRELVCSPLTQLLWLRKQAPGLAFKKTTAAGWLLLGFPWNSLYIVSYIFPINPFLQMWLEDSLLWENSCFDLKSRGNFSLRKKWWLREQSLICFK